MTAAVLLIHELLCAALFYSSFCRAVMSDRRTRPALRFVIVLSGLVACIGMWAPIAWKYQPDWFALLLLATSVTAQALMSRHWRHGVPEIFREAAR